MSKATTKKQTVKFPARITIKRIGIFERRNDLTTATLIKEACKTGQSIYVATYWDATMQREPGEHYSNLFPDMEPVFPQNIDMMEIDRIVTKKNQHSITATSVYTDVSYCALSRDLTRFENSPMRLVAYELIEAFED